MRFPDPTLSKIINPSFIEGTYLLKGNKDNCFDNVVEQCAIIFLLFLKLSIEGWLGGSAG